MSHLDRLGLLTPRAVDDRLARQIAFLVEIDKLKLILRRTPLANGSRAENSAEHSWHLVMCAMVLKEYAAEPADLSRALQMLAVHDIVEIDAGDTFAYDIAAHASKIAREQRAADRLFGLLPPDQADGIRALWNEFEAMHTPESRLANAVDRLQALLLNAESGGGSWRSPGVTRAAIEARMALVTAAMPSLAPLVDRIVETFSRAGAIGPES
jgi:putative hydrolase of HD superfamily